jgi:hypothetical protein
MALDDGLDLIERTWASAFAHLGGCRQICANWQSLDFKINVDCTWQGLHCAHACVVVSDRATAANSIGNSA